MRYSNHQAFLCIDEHPNTPFFVTLQPWDLVDSAWETGKSHTYAPSIVVDATCQFWGRIVAIVAFAMLHWIKPRSEGITIFRTWGKAVSAGQIHLAQFTFIVLGAETSHTIGSIKSQLHPMYILEKGRREVSVQLQVVIWRISRMQIEFEWVAVWMQRPD